MQIKPYSSFDELSLEAAQFIYAKIKTQIKETASFNLGLATGQSTKEIYKHLVNLLDISHLNLSDFHTVNLGEYYPIDQSDENSFFQEVFHGFWGPLNDGNQTFDFANGHILNTEEANLENECSNFEKLLKDIGGIDIQIMEMGIDGQIGFNEPGSEGKSRTRKVELSAKTIEKLSKTMKTVPKSALTMGIGTILESKEVVLLATGHDKQKVFDKLIALKEPTTDIPASFLINHPLVTVFTDLSKEV